MHDRPMDKENYILDAHFLRESSQNNQVAFWADRLSALKRSFAAKKFNETQKVDNKICNIDNSISYVNFQYKFQPSKCINVRLPQFY